MSSGLRFGNRITPVLAIPQIDFPLIEAFSSFQGEGTLVGYRQIFLRFPQCNLNCNYCDTPFAPSATCSIEDPPGSSQLQKLDNPVSWHRLSEIFARWCAAAPNAHHSFSITGGEPLLHSELLQRLLPEMRKLLPIYLETNGTLPEALEPLLPFLEWISMDIKLESVVGQASDWEAHRRFLELAARTNCYVKIVVGNSTTRAEIEHAANLVNRVSSAISLILQPVTIDGKAAVETNRLFLMQELAATIHSNVRIIPQTHVFLGLI